MYVESKVELNLPKSNILNLIREPGNLNKFHPFCKKNKIISWPGNGSVDRLEYHNGMKFNREFYNLCFDASIRCNTCYCPCRNE